MHYTAPDLGHPAQDRGEPNLDTDSHGRLRLTQHERDEAILAQMYLEWQARQRTKAEEAAKRARIRRELEELRVRDALALELAL